MYQKFFLFLFITISTLFSTVQATSFLGKLDQLSQDQFEITSLEGEKIKLKINEKYHYGLQSLTQINLEEMISKSGDAYPEFFLLFDGEHSPDGFSATQTPRLVSGTQRINGELKKNGNEYSINGIELEFTKAYLTNGTSFSMKSSDFYVGKMVSVLVKKQESQKLIITAIVSQIYTAKREITNKSSGIMKGIETASKKEVINKYLLEEIYRDEFSQTGKPFRKIIFEKDNAKVFPGAKALVITLSGRQGDSSGSIAGHIAAGIATVQNDLSLDMEIWNYYDVPNTKYIMSGHNDYLDYFGNLTAGQNNYRPTYTLIFYGVDEKIMKKMRDELGIDFYKMREASKDFGTFYNCATETVKALKKHGVKAKKLANPFTHIAKKLGAAAVLPFTVLSRPFTTYGRSLEYSIFSDPSRYIPRAAFDGYLKNIWEIQKKLNISRIDYIFHKQVDSDRKIGGAPSTNTIETIMGNLSVD